MYVLTILVARILIKPGKFSIVGEGSGGVRREKGLDGRAG